MKCVECETGDVTETTSNWTQTIDDKIYVIPHIKVLRCQQCGEEYIPQETSEYLDNIFFEELKVQRKEKLTLRRNISKTGKKMFVYIPDDIKRNLHLHPQQVVEFSVENGKIVVDPISETDRTELRQIQQKSRH